MTIEWRRGFFRAWAVLAMLWILFIGWNEYKNWVMHPNPVLAEACWNRLAKWQDGKPFGVWDYDNDTPNGSSKADQWRAEVRLKLTDCEAATSFMKKWEAELGSGDAALALTRVLLPPFGLLIAGCILGWVARGFRAIG